MRSAVIDEAWSEARHLAAHIHTYIHAYNTYIERLAIDAHGPCWLCLNIWGFFQILVLVSPSS